jgi:hypothetical protein
MVVVRLGLAEREVKIPDEVYGAFLKRIGGALVRKGPETP